MCSIPPKNPATKHFYQPIICCSVIGFSNVALSSLIYEDFCPFYSTQMPPMSPLIISSA